MNNKNSIIIDGNEYNNKYIGTKKLMDCRKFITTCIHKKQLPQYSWLTGNVGLPTSGLGLIKSSSSLLWAMSLEDYKNGRPLMSSLVVRKDRGTPGSGFYLAAAELKRYDGSTKPANQFHFWGKEVAEAILYYGFK